MDLTDIRDRIDEVDEQLVKLLSERIQLAAQASTAKWKQGLPINDNKREQEICVRAAKLAGREFAPYTLRFFQAIFSITKDYQVQRAALDRWPGNNI
jgi:chorismate mutase